MEKMKIYFYVFVYFCFLSCVAGQSVSSTTTAAPPGASTNRPAAVVSTTAVNAGAAITPTNTAASTPSTTTRPTALSSITTTGTLNAVPTTTISTPDSTSTIVSITTTGATPTTTAKVDAEPTTTAKIVEISSTVPSVATTNAAIVSTSGGILQSESTAISPIADPTKYEYSAEINQLIQEKVKELEKSIDVATNKMNELNRTLDSIIKYRMRLDAIAKDLDLKVFEDLKLLRDVEDQIKQMDIVEKQLDLKETMLLTLQRRETSLGNKIEHDLNVYDDPNVLDRWNISFFAQRNSTFNIKTVIHPYDIAPLNQGQCFSPSSGIFTVPFNGIYYFYFTALKTKKQESGTSRLTIQLVKNRKTVPTLRKVLAEVHLDSADWYGWFPLHLQATATLKEKDEIAAELLEGSFYESGSPDHLLTDFGGFLITRLYN